MILVSIVIVICLITGITTADIVQTKLPRNAIYIEKRSPPQAKAIYFQQIVHFRI